MKKGVKSITKVSKTNTEISNEKYLEQGL